MKRRGWIAIVLALVCAVLALVGQLHRTGRADGGEAELAQPIGGAATAELMAVAREPSDVGEAEPWPYQSLSAEERAVIDRGRDVQGWDAVHAAFSAASPAYQADPASSP